MNNLQIFQELTQYKAKLPRSNFFTTTQYAIHHSITSSLLTPNTVLSSPWIGQTCQIEKCWTNQFVPCSWTNISWINLISHPHLNLQPFFVQIPEQTFQLTILMSPPNLTNETATLLGVKLNKYWHADCMQCLRKSCVHSTVTSGADCWASQQCVTYWRQQYINKNDKFLTNRSSCCGRR